MTDLQSKLLDMLVWFDHFCRENHLRYYAIRGTLLGAVRHEGFIPWDDDIDVALPRKDYDRLAQLMGSEIHDGFIVLETENSTDEKYCYPFSKLYNTTTTAIENVSTKLKRGVYIDVFPLDGIGNGEQPDWKWLGKIRHRCQFHLARITGIRKGRSFARNAAAVLAKAIPKRILNNRALRLRISEMCRKYDFDSSDWAGNLLGNWDGKEVMPREIFGEPVPYRFEGHEILGFEKADEFLTNLYGDWRQLPPEEKRVGHHDYIVCDPHKSYLEP